MKKVYGANPERKIVWMTRATVQLFGGDVLICNGWRSRTLLPRPTRKHITVQDTTKGILGFLSKYTIVFFFFVKHIVDSMN